MQLSYHDPKLFVVVTSLARETARRGKEVRSKLAVAFLALCLNSSALAADNVGEFIEKGGGTWMTVDDEFKFVTTPQSHTWTPMAWIGLYQPTSPRMAPPFPGRSGQ